MGRRITELFYELRANTEGLQKDLDDGERQLGKFSGVRRDEPDRGRGALGVAIAGVGVEADAHGRAVDARCAGSRSICPKARGHRALGDRDHERLRMRPAARRRDARLFETISKQGVSSAAEIETRAAAIEKFADATNATETTAAGWIS
jgi:hypothetical protein